MPFAEAGDLPAKTFWLCLQKRATGFAVRALRLHYFPEENRYVVIYTEQGQDQVKCQGTRRSVCEKVLNKIKTDLEKGLWECEPFQNVKVFYPHYSAAVLNPSGQNVQTLFTEGKSFIHKILNPTPMRIIPFGFGNSDFSNERIFAPFPENMKFKNSDRCFTLARLTAASASKSHSFLNFMFSGKDFFSLNKKLKV